MFCLSTFPEESSKTKSLREKEGGAVMGDTLGLMPRLNKGKKNVSPPGTIFPSYRAAIDTAPPLGLRRVMWGNLLIWLRKVLNGAEGVFL